MFYGNTDFKIYGHSGEEVLAAFQRLDKVNTQRQNNGNPEFLRSVLKGENKCQLHFQPEFINWWQPWLGMLKTYLYSWLQRHRHWPYGNPDFKMYGINTLLINVLASFLSFLFTTRGIDQLVSILRGFRITIRAYPLWRWSRESSCLVSWMKINFVLCTGWWRTYKLCLLCWICHDILATDACRSAFLPFHLLESSWHDMHIWIISYLECTYVQLVVKVLIWGLALQRPRYSYVCIVAPSTELFTLLNAGVGVFMKGK